MKTEGIGVMEWWSDGAGGHTSSQHSNAPILQRPNPRRRSGFTLLELLIAIVILITVVVLVASIYSNTLKAWNQAEGVIDELHQGDYIIEQVVGAIRSSAFFPNNRKIYGFWLDDRGASASAHDQISFVTSSSAFIPSDSPYQNSLHRLFITVDSDRQGRDGLVVRALPHMSKDKELADAEPWLVSSRVTGFDCRVYDWEQKDWSDTWEDTNKIPGLVKITLTIKPVKDDAPPLEISRVIEIPIAPAVSAAVAVARSGGGAITNGAGTRGGVGGFGVGGGRNSGTGIGSGGNRGGGTSGFGTGGSSGSGWGGSGWGNNRGSGFNNGGNNRGSSGLGGGRTPRLPGGGR